MVGVPRLIVGRSELRMKDSVEPEHDTTLIGVIEVGPLGEDSASRVVGE